MNFDLSPQLQELEARVRAFVDENRDRLPDVAAPAEWRRKAETQFREEAEDAW